MSPFQGHDQSRLKLYERSRGEPFVGLWVMLMPRCFKGPQHLGGAISNCGHRRKTVMENSPLSVSELLAEFPRGGLGCSLVIAVYLSSFPVCVSYLGRFYQDLKDRDVTFSPASIEKELVKFCREARGKENRLVSSVTLPSWPWPVFNTLLHRPGKRLCAAICARGWGECYP